MRLLRVCNPSLIGRQRSLAWCLLQKSPSSLSMRWFSTQPTTSSAAAATAAVEKEKGAPSSAPAAAKPSTPPPPSESKPAHSYRNPIPEEFASVSPPLMRWLWLAGGVLVVGSAVMAVRRYREFRGDMQDALLACASADEVTATQGLDRLEKLLRRQHYSMTGLTVVRTHKTVLVDNGAIEALVHAFSRPNGSPVVRVRALELLVKILRDAPEARAHLATVGLDPLLQLLESQSVAPSTEPKHWLLGMMLLELMSAGYDSGHLLAQDSRVHRFLETELQGGRSGRADPLATLLLARTRAATREDESPQTGALVDPRAYNPAYAVALDAALQELVPSEREDGDVGGLTKKLLDALGLSLFGSVYGYARWSVRMRLAGTPLRGREFWHFVTHKSRVGKCLFLVLVTDILLSEAQRNWAYLSHLAPELYGEVFSGENSSDHQQQQHQAQPPQAQPHAYAVAIPSSVVWPVGQTLATTSLWLMCQRRQRFMILPTSLALAHYYWNDVQSYAEIFIKKVS